MAYVKTFEDEFILDKDGVSLPISKKAIEHFHMPELNYNKDIKLDENLNFYCCLFKSLFNKNKKGFYFNLLTSIDNYSFTS